MSMPACRRPQRIPKGETTGPFTGQISCPLPCLNVPPEATLDGAPATRACSRSSAARSPSRRTRLSCTWASAPRLSARAEASWSRAPTSWFSTAAIWSRSRRIRSAASCSRSSRSASWIAWSCARSRSPRTSSVISRSWSEMRSRNSARSSRSPKPSDVEDHGERVGRVGLVDLDQPGGEHPARGRELAAQPLEPVARRLQPVAHGEQLAPSARRGCPAPATGGARWPDLALDRVDAGVESAGWSC